MITQESVTTAMYVFFVFAGVAVVIVGLLGYWDTKTRLKLKKERKNKKK